VTYHFGILTHNVCHHAMPMVVNLKQAMSRG